MKNSNTTAAYVRVGLFHVISLLKDDEVMNYEVQMRDSSNSLVLDRYDNVCTYAYV